MEYCTVKCDIGRQTGKTEYILRKIMKFPNSIVIVPTLEVKERQYKTANYVFTPREEFHIGILPAPIKFVFFDESAWIVDEHSLTRNSLYELYSKIYRRSHFNIAKDVTFVHLG